MDAVFVQEVLDYLSKIEKELMQDCDCYIVGYKIIGTEKRFEYSTSHGKTVSVSFKQMKEAK